MGEGIRQGQVTGLPGELLVSLAEGERALSGSGDLAVSREAFGRAYQLAELAGEPEAMAVAALGLAGLWVSERRTIIGAAMLETRLKHALSLLGGQSSLALRIRARLAAEADYRGGAHTAILAALAEAREAEDPLALAEALSLAHHCLLGPGEVKLRRELAAELIRVSFRTGRRSDRLMGLLWQTADAYAAGELHVGRLLGELRERDHAAVGFVASAIDVMLAIRAGRLAEAESLVAVCAARGAAAGDIDAEWWPGAQLVTIRWYQGRLPELLPMLRDRAHSPNLSAVDNSTLGALAVASALQGDRPEAAGCLAALRGTGADGRGLASLPRGSSWLATMNAVTEAACLLGDEDAAGEAYDLLLPYAELPLVGGLGITCFGSAYQALGIAALARRQLDLAVEHLHLAVLIGSPRQEIAAADLAAGVAGIAGAAARDATSHHLLDAEAIARYRGRLRRLDAELGAQAPGGDAAGAARAEREWLVSQLASAAGLGGRPRSFPDDAERARVAVGKAIRRALTRITAADAVIGEHLRQAVRTGARCSYWPG